MAYPSCPLGAFWFFSNQKDTPPLCQAETQDSVVSLRDRIKVVELPEFPDSEDSLLQQLLVLPRQWEGHIGNHDVYLLGNFPAQYVRKRPAVHLMHEPLRLLYDRRLVQIAENAEQDVHLYPRLDYISEHGGKLAAELGLIEEFDARARLDKIVTSSRKTSEYIRTVYGKPADLVAYPGVTSVSERQDLHRVKRAVFAGNLWPHKRVDLLVEAISMIPDGELLIVVDGPERESLTAKAKQLNVTDRVRFAGRVSRVELTKLYAESVCGAYVPENEPLGMVPLDVAAAGRPSIITRDGGYTKILGDSCAMIVAPNAVKIAAALRTLFSDSSLANELGAAARRKAATLRWDDTAAQIMEIMQDTAEQSRRSSGREPIYGAHYYPWYRSGDLRRHWNENSRYAAVTDLPLAGTYDSSQVDTVKRHLTTAKAAGLDHFVVNLHIDSNGVQEHDLKATRELFSQSERIDFRLAVLLVIETTDPSVIEDSVRAVLREFTKSKAYLKLRQRPAVWYFVNAQFVGYFYNYERSFSDLHRDFCLIATGGSPYGRLLPRHLRERFNGWSPYSPLQLCPNDRWREVWERSYYDFHADSTANSVRMFTVCPGYDDTALECPVRAKQEHRVFSREAGSVFTLMQEVALDLDPPPEVVTLTSFNEFHENTHIEPSTCYGDDYVESSKRLRDQMLAKHRSRCSRVPSRTA